MALPFGIVFAFSIQPIQMSIWIRFVVVVVVIVVDDVAVAVSFIFHVSFREIETIHLLFSHCFSLSIQTVNTIVLSH